MYQYQHPISYKDTLLTPRVITLSIPISHKKYDISNTVVSLGKLVQCTYSLQTSIEFGSVIIEESDMQVPVNICLGEIESEPVDESQLIRLSRSMYI